MRRTDICTTELTLPAAFDVMLGPRLAGVAQLRTVDHSCNTCFGGSDFALATRPRGRVENAARETRTAQASLGIANCLSFGVSSRIASFDHPARAFANDCAISHQYGAIRLIAPRFGQAFHRRRGFKPALLRLGWRVPTLCGRGDSPTHQEHCTDRRAGQSVSTWTIGLRVSH